MRFPHYKKVVCKDGATVSVQASSLHYSTPREDDGPYTHIEAGYPSMPPPASWKPYMDGCEDDDPCQTVYGYMPTAYVWEFIDAHGGMADGELPPFAESRESVKTGA